MTTKTKEAPKDQTPEGYMRNAQGHLVPVEMVSELDMMRDATVLELVQEAKNIARTLSEFKGRAFDTIAKFADTSAEKYGAKLGGKKGNITLHSFDGAFKITLQVAENIVFDERLQAAKALIDECITEWAENSRAEIKVLVQQAFDTDKEGKLNTGRILGLRRLEITDARWKSAMKAIGDSVTVVGTKQYVRFYERVAGGDAYEAVSLDMATL